MLLDFRDEHVTQTWQQDSELSFGDHDWIRIKLMKQINSLPALKKIFFLSETKEC